MKTAENFFKWAFETRANTVLKMIYSPEEMTQEKVFLSFCSHDPCFVSNGPAGLNAAIKGIGFMPKPEYLEETLNAYIEHINTYSKEDKTYGQRGLKLLEKYMYGEEARSRIDFTQVGSLEMAKKHSYINYKANPEATLCFYQPPSVSYELRGKMLIKDQNDSGQREIYQQFINAQHDVYHAPNMERWITRPAYLFQIEEVWDNCVSKDGFGTQMIFPYE